MMLCEHELVTGALTLWAVGYANNGLSVVICSHISEKKSIQNNFLKPVF
jgi:hypothetical protein